MSVWWFKAHSVHLKVFPQSRLPQDCSKCEFPSRIKASSKLSLFVKAETGSILTDTTEKGHILPYSSRSERASNEDCIQGRLRHSDSPQFSKFLPGTSLECTNNHIITTSSSRLTWTSYPSTSAPLLSVYPDTWWTLANRTTILAFYGLLSWKDCFSSPSPSTPRAAGG